MKLTNHKWFGAGKRMGLCLIGMVLIGLVLGRMVRAASVSTTTVQGTVYLANGQPGTGTLVVSWPAFTTANGQLVAADKTTVTIAPDGFVSVSLAPNQGATPAGQYYTAVYYLSDGTTSTQYWVVPAAAQATLGQVQAQLMPAAQAVQTVSKAYVDQAVSELSQSLLTASGGTLSGPLYLNGDPTQSLQAADKHYVDSTVALAVPLAGGGMAGALTTPAVNGVESPAAGSTQTTLQSAVTSAGSNGAVIIPPGYMGNDTFTNSNGVYVTDLRSSKSQQTERSVKEFGAVCDGATDDTNALQSALNYANTHGVALTIPQGTCKTQTLNWHGESIGGMGKQVSALMGFPGQDVLATATDSVSLLSYTRIHDLTIYVDQSLDASCSPAEGRASAGVCAENRPLESNSIFSPGGNGLTGTAGTGAGWSVGNCAIAMPAATGAGGNGLRVAEVENVEIVATGVDPMAAQYSNAHSTHTCGMYLAQWPQWSEFRNIDIRGLNTGIAIPALPVSTPAGLNSDSNRWQNITIEATHGFAAAAGSNNVLDNVVVAAGNSAATGEPPTGLVLDLANTQQGWTVRNSVVMPVWKAVLPSLSVTASGGAVTTVTVGSEHGLGFDPYGTLLPLKFSGSCTAQAAASVNSNGSIGAVTVAQGGAGCSGTTTASINAAGTWDTAAPVNLIAGQNMSFFNGNLLKGNGGYTVWNATASQSYGTQLGAGGGTLPGGGSYAALVANNALGNAYQVDQFPGADFGAKLQACLGTVSSVYGGTCDARNFTGSLSMGSNLTILTGNTTVLLPCATVSTANQLIVTAGTRNVALRGCALRGASTASGSQGGTVFLYSGTSAMVQVGDPTYAANTMGFHLENVVINTTAATNSTAQGLVAYRTQEMDLDNLYFLGNSNQTGMTLDGTGNYTGGTFYDNEFNGFQTAVNAVGHQVSNSATTDWMNASTFVRLHIDCPTSGGSPISGTYGINLQQGDGNTFTGGDVEGCATALHLGANAQNNTIVGLRNENSNNQVVADAGSSYNNWMTGGTMFTGQLTDNGTRNSFLDTFHRSFNGMNGDWYGSQKDATVTNHYRLGIGAGNERGLLDRYQTDSGYRWTMGLSDATAGEQFYQILDELDNVYRLSIGQYSNGQSSTNNQTVINAAGTGAVVLNGSNNAGTGGVVFGSGGANEATVAAIDKSGDAQFNGTLQVGGATTFASTPTVKNQADAEIDTALWAGLTTSQKESFIYKDWNGNSQWYMVKDASDNWALNSAIGGLDSFKAYQSTNSGDTYIDASNSSGAVRINYETGSGTGFSIYGGNSSTLYASFTGTTSIKFPGLAATSGHNCLQVDNSGYISNTGSACGSGGTNGTVNAGSSGQIAYYSSNGTVLAGTSTVAVASGGTGSATATGALVNLGGVSVTQTATQTMLGALNLPTLEGTLNADQLQSPAGNGNNGIAMSLAQCATHSYACMIQAPALYAQTEAQPFGGANNYAPPLISGPTSSQPLAGVLDLRYGVPQWMFSGSQLLSDLRQSAEPTFAMFNIAGAGPGTFAHYASALGLQTSAFAGGRNFYNDKSEFENLSIQTYKYTQAQGGGDIAQSVYCIGNGDCAGHTINTISYGGPNTASDEGNESMRFEAIEGGQVFGANLASITTASDSSVTFTTTAQTYNGFQGEGRLLIDLSKAYNGVANGNYIASISAVNGDEVVTCGGSCNWDSYGVSTHTTLTAIVGNSTVPAATITAFSQTGSVATFTAANSFTAGQTARFVGGTLNGTYLAVLPTGLSATQFSVATSTVIGANSTSASVSASNTFPQSPTAGVTLSVASSANFTVGNLACIFDYDYECEKITAVGTGTVTIATDRLPHLVGAYVTTGGLAGSSIEFEPDRVVPGNTNGISTLPDVGLVSTVRNAIPIMYNSSGNTLAFFQGGNTLPGTSGSYTGRAYKSAPGSGGAVTLTVAGNVVTSVSCTGGTGYIASIPLQVTATYGAGGGTAPTVYTITTGSGGALSTCGFTPGSNLATATSNALPSNPYDIYPTTKVTSVYDAAAGSVDGTFYTEPLINTVGTWAVSDLVEEPHYFYQHIRGSNNVVGTYIPSLGASADVGLGYTLDGLWKGSDTALSIANNTNPTVYAGYPGATPWVPGLGQVFAPYGMTLNGPFNTGLYMTTPPYGNYGAAVEVNCSYAPVGCSGWTNSFNLLGVQGWNGSANVYDGLSYNPSTRAWALTGASLALPASTTGPSINISGTSCPLGGSCTLSSSGSYTTAQSTPQYLQGAVSGSSYGYVAMQGNYDSPGWNFFAAVSPTSWYPSMIEGDTSGDVMISQCPAAVTALNGSSTSGCNTTLVIGNNTTNVGNGYSLGINIPNLSASTSLGISLGGANFVTGPSASVVGHVATFSNATGAIQDSGAAPLTSFTAPSASWPSWLAPTVTNSTITPSLAVAASAIPNSALVNSSTTVNGQACALGGTCTVTVAMPSVPKMVGASPTCSNLSANSCGGFFFYPVANATALRLDVSLGGESVGCTTLLTWSLYDFTTSRALMSVATTNGSYGPFSSTTALSGIVAGDKIGVEATTLAAGCTTNPANLSWILQYQ